MAACIGPNKLKVYSSHKSGVEPMALVEKLEIRNGSFSLRAG